MNNPQQQRRRRTRQQRPMLPRQQQQQQQQQTIVTAQMTPSPLLELPAGAASAAAPADLLERGVDHNNRSSSSNNHDYTTTASRSTMTTPMMMQHHAGHQYYDHDVHDDVSLIIDNTTNNNLNDDDNTPTMEPPHENDNTGQRTSRRSSSSSWSPHTQLMSAAASYWISPYKTSNDNINMGLHHRHNGGHHHHQHADIYSDDDDYEDVVDDDGEYHSYDDYYHHHRNTAATADIEENLDGEYSSPEDKYHKHKPARRGGHGRNNHNNNRRLLVRQPRHRQRRSASMAGHHPPQMSFDQWIRLVAMSAVAVYLLLAFQTAIQDSWQLPLPGGEGEEDSLWSSSRTTTTTTTNTEIPSPMSGGGGGGFFMSHQHTTTPAAASTSSSSYSQYYYLSPFSALSAWRVDQQRQRTRRAIDSAETTEYQNVVVLEKQRAAQRRDRTRPPPLLSPLQMPDSHSSSSSYYNRDLLLLEEEEEMTIDQYADVIHSRPATLEELCGYHAQNASLTYPQQYVQHNALNAQSRVLITGLLTHPVGFHLALRLKQRCGVEVMTGVDPVVPGQTQHEKLRLQEKLAILTTQIPQFVRPILTPYIGLDPVGKKKRKNAALLESTGELDVVAGFRPTHIIHLAAAVSSSSPATSSTTTDPSSPLYSFRANMVTMEQILRSIADHHEQHHAPQPHFTYASSLSSQTTSRQQHQRVASSCERIDDILAAAYSATHNIDSTAVRLPSIVYGPSCGDDRSGGSTINQIIERVLDEDGGGGNTIDATNNITADTTLSPSLLDDIAYVDDVVDAIIAAMQFRRSTAAAANGASKPMTFQIAPGSRQLVKSTDDIEQLVRASLLSSTDVVSQQQQAADTVIKAPDTAETSVALQHTQRYLGWSHRTDLVEGLRRTIAWHLDRRNPYGRGKTATSTTESASSSSVATGDAFLEHHSMETCAADDVMCHASRPLLPCASECSTRSKCPTSLFDGLVTMTRELTEGCDYVLYTQSLGRHVSELTIHSEYMEEGAPLICNFAFVSRESALVQSVIQKVPQSQLSDLGVSPHPEGSGGMPVSGSGDSIHEQKLEKLNGRLLYKGWILLWPTTPPSPVSTADASLLKLSPGRFFSNDVKAAVFIEDNFLVSPTAEDIAFLVHETQRPAWATRVVKQRNDPIKKVKLRVPSEPPRRAALLLSELKRQDSLQEPLETTNNNQQTSKINVLQATKFMRFENGEKFLKKEPPHTKRQREFYEHIPSYVNLQTLRSPADPYYKYELKHWARTRWVVHDLQLDEARDLRCDWYQEHVTWGTNLDQLSFAHVMARRELERRIEFNEPDDHMKRARADTIEKKKTVSDQYEWYGLQTEGNRRYPDTDVLDVLPYELPNEDIAASPDLVDAQPVPLFVRIISDRITALSRKAWKDSRRRAAKNRRGK